MYIQSMLEKIEHKLGEIGYIKRVNNDGEILIIVYCEDGIIIDLGFKNEEERSLLWDELCHNDPMSLINFCDYSLIYYKHIHVMNLTKTEQGTPAIKLCFAKLPPLTLSYANQQECDDDYWTIVRGLSEYHGASQNVFVNTLLQ